MNDWSYYKDTGSKKWASRISLHIRKRMFHKFMSIYQPTPSTKVLDIGVTVDDQYEESNYFEKMYPYANKVVCVGVEDGSYLEAKYPGLKFISIKPHEPLPFDDKEFDIAFSNAVIEHVGNEQSQKKFIHEMIRVSNAFFVTTPNRWFPVEFHTALPLLHYLPPKTYRKLLWRLGEEYWSKEENLNLLSRTQLRSLFPEEINTNIDTVQLFGIVTNILAYGRVA